MSEQYSNIAEVSMLKKGKDFLEKYNIIDTDLEELKGLIDENNKEKLDTEDEYNKKVSERLKGMNNVSYEVAAKLIDSGLVKVVLNNISNFDAKQHKRIVEHIIIQGLGIELSESTNFSELKGMNWNIAVKLIDSGRGDIVLNNFNQFPKKEFYNFVPELIKQNTDFFLNKVLDLSLNDKQKLFILQRLINNGDSGKLLYDHHLDSFKGLQVDIVDLMLEKGDRTSIITYMLDFTELSKEFFIKRHEQIGISEEYINNIFARKKSKLGNK